MIDKTIIDHVLHDLRERKLTHAQVSEKHGVSPRTITRLVKKHNLYRGQGVKHYWVYDTMSKDLAYVIGAYITDGSLMKRPDNKIINSGVRIGATSYEFSHQFERSLNNICVKTSSFIIEPTGKMTKPQRCVCSYSKMFADWLEEICDGKNRIPQIIFDATKEERLAFLAGVIDGDGSVTKDGCIRVRSSQGWAEYLPNFLDSLAIRNGYSTHITPNGKPYHYISIRRMDFVDVGGWVVVVEKLLRIISGKMTKDMSNH